ncbi:hypothetical protein GH733_010518 [Mirounga leonina]|nr:hypothetical protein GH733_010518 [Mirounga leonina]
MKWTNRSLKIFFQSHGNVVELCINSGKKLPSLGFVVFDDSEPLSLRPIMFRGEFHLNMEEKTQEGDHRDNCLWGPRGPKVQPGSELSGPPCGGTVQKPGFGRENEAMHGLPCSQDLSGAFAARSIHLLWQNQSSHHRAPIARRMKRYTSSTNAFSFYEIELTHVPQFPCTPWTFPSSIFAYIHSFCQSHLSPVPQTHIRYFEQREPRWKLTEKLAPGPCAALWAGTLSKSLHPPLKNEPPDPPTWPLGVEKTSKGRGSPCISEGASVATPPSAKNLRILQKLSRFEPTKGSCPVEPNSGLLEKSTDLLHTFGAGSFLSPAGHDWRMDGINLI